VIKSKQKGPVSAEVFESIVIRIDHRVRSFLAKEAVIGHSTRIAGYSRIDDLEFYKRLARLRDQTRTIFAKSRKFFDENSGLVDCASQIPSANNAENTLSDQNFSRLHKGTIEKNLIKLHCAIEDVLSLSNSISSYISERIAPESSIVLLTPQEVEMAFEDVSEAMLLAGLLRIDREMRGAAYEVIALLSGRSNPGKNLRGPYERRRGSWITAHLVGLAEGHGLHPTRNTSPQQHVPLHSAADAVAIVIGQLRLDVSKHQASFEGFSDWRDDPAACAVLAEMPNNRGEEFDPQAVADNIIRKIIKSKEPSIVQARNVGMLIGERETKKTTT